MTIKPNSRFWLLTISLILLTGWKPYNHSGHHPTTPMPSYLTAAGIGVSNIDASVAFYTHGLGMKELERAVRKDRIEVVMESADAKGSNILLMQYTDGKERIFNRNPGKIVFYASDANQFASNIILAGGQIFLPPSAQPQFGGALVGFGRDLDNNLIEIVEYPETDHSFMSAFGIGVSDLENARDFYVEVFGLKQQSYIEIPGLYNEYILESPVPGSSALVLMHWTNNTERNYQNNPVKLQIATGLPKQLMHTIKRSQHNVIQFPHPRSRLNGAVAGYAKDEDGTLLEIRRSNKSYLGAAGIGVADLDASVAFYTSGLSMREVERRVRHNRIEAVMESADSRGSNIVLMEFTDGKQRTFTQNPGKLVFYVKDTTHFVYSILAAGGQILLPPTPQPDLGGIEVGFGRDINNNLIEIVGVPSANHSYLAAFGIGVSDLEVAKDFYTNVLGFKLDRFLSTPSYDEYILHSTGGSALVLMHWTNGSERNYKNNPIKLELRTLSPRGTATNIKQSGGKVIRTHQNAIYGKDADGTLLELLKAPWGTE